MFAFLNPYVLLGFLVYSLAGGAFCVWQGYKWADRSAEITALEQSITTANATIARLRTQAEADAAAVNKYAQREQLANDALTDLQETIDALSETEDARPAADVCRLDDAAVASLRALALRASPDRAAAPPGPQHVRPAGPRTTPP